MVAMRIFAHMAYTATPTSSYLSGVTLGVLYMSGLNISFFLNPCPLDRYLPNLSCPVVKYTYPKYSTETFDKGNVAYCGDILPAHSGHDHIHFPGFPVSV